MRAVQIVAGTKIRLPDGSEGSTPSARTRNPRPIVHDRVKHQQPITHFFILFCGMTQKHATAGEALPDASQRPGGKTFSGDFRPHCRGLAWRCLSGSRIFRILCWLINRVISAGVSCMVSSPVCLAFYLAILAVCPNPQMENPKAPSIPCMIL